MDPNVQIVDMKFMVFSMNKHLYDLKYLFSRSDLILIVSIMILSLVLFSSLLIKKEDNRIIKIFVDNQPFGSYSLNHNQVINIDHHNHVEIKKGKARMKFSSCKNQTCVQQGWSSTNPIVCIPNKTSVQFLNSKSEKKDKRMLITH